MTAGDDLHMVQDDNFDDPTGIAVSSDKSMKRSYGAITGSKAGQHVHTRPTDPETVTGVELRDGDIWFDSTS